jgi:hypothetical protein
LNWVNHSVGRKDHLLTSCAAQGLATVIATIMSAPG